MAAPKVPAGWELEQEQPVSPPAGWELEAEAAPPRIPEAPAAPTASLGESALQGYAQGASFGMVDELGGVVHQGVKTLAGGAGGAMKSGPGRALIRKLAPGLRDQPDAVIDAVIDEGLDQGAETVLGARARSSGGPGFEGAGYSGGRDQMRAEAKKAQESNPKTFFASNLAGAMSVPMPGGAAKPFQTVIGRSLENAGKFGAAGAAQGFGTSDADLLKGEFGKAAADTALGAGVGAGMGFATGPAAYAWARNARPALQSLARSSAVSAVAPSSGLLNRLRRAGYRNEPELHELGQEILDMGILRPLGGAAGAQGRTAAILAEEGAAIGEAMGKADDLVSQGVARPPSRDLQQVAVRDALTKAADTPATRALKPSVESRLLTSTGVDPTPPPAWLTGGRPGFEWWDDAPPATFRELWKNKSQLQSALKPDEFSSLGQKLYRKGVGGYTKGVYNQVEGAVGPDDVAALRESARKYGTATKVEDLLSEQVSRKGANQPISLGDAARGAALEGTVPGGGGVGMLISALMRGRTASTLATGANALSKVRPQLPGALLKGGSEGAREALDEDEEASIQAFLRSP